MFPLNMESRRDFLLHEEIGHVHMDDTRVRKSKPKKKDYPKPLDVSRDLRQCLKCAKQLPRTTQFFNIVGRGYRVHCIECTGPVKPAPIRRRMQTNAAKKQKKVKPTSPMVASFHPPVSCLSCENLAAMDIDVVQPPAPPPPLSPQIGDPFSFSPSTLSEISASSAENSLFFHDEPLRLESPPLIVSNSSIEDSLGLDDAPFITNSFSPLHAGPSPFRFQSPGPSENPVGYFKQIPPCDMTPCSPATQVARHLVYSDYDDMPEFQL